MSIKTLDIIEIFGNDTQWAIQGEGRFAGVPSTFIRTFGCNLQCKFGMTEDPEGVERFKKLVRGSVDRFETLEELPVYNTFCDTYYSLFPEFRKFTTKYTPYQLVQKLGAGFCNYYGEAKHLVITGGEPLLAHNQDFWVDFILDAYRLLCVKHLTFETNTTQELSTYFMTHKFNTKIHFSMSPKLSSAGYTLDQNCQPDVVHSILEYCNVSYNGGDCWFKFVVNDERDIDEIKEYMNRCHLGSRKNAPAIYLMPEGGTREQLDLNAKKVYELCAKYGYCYSPRHQVSIMNNGIGI